MTLAVVVDASVACKWFVEEPESDIAGLLLGDVVLHAPRLLFADLANSLWKNWRRDRVDLEQAQFALSSIGQMISHWHAVEPLLQKSITMAFELDHPVYDLAYLTLAKTLRIRCVTADRRLYRKVAGSPYAAQVQLLSDLT